MQIPSIQYNTAASAASPLQAGRESAPKSTSATPTTAPGVEHVEQGLQSQDRDAQELYIGGRKKRGDQLEEEQQDEEKAEPSLLDLEVDDLEGPSSLDIVG